ncbi:M20/M25/M40 family metallo-hydrolase [Streptococcus sp. DD12]|uniref:M20/M25/M40 family metallo-hydrolase n=1 Tax=Streptococcus sp. DD12 TaxID=1777880 RepID=UPI000791E82B|nr:M20/M25/M40 family metallo-hydrolase [Streptococcus sp. DD12]KXT75230.1 Acetylornithine deacetylase/Succinyl-diaminopimelate desuccinylase or related deacylase [Streptococcus sp. DD12]
MAFASKEEQIEKFNQDHTIKHYVKVLRRLISMPSIFAQKKGLKEVALYLGELFEEAGADVLIDEAYTAPLVIARFESPNPEAKTIIFYNHYDTVPADSDQPWTEDPFTLSIRGDYMYGRGVDDDKGHITARLTAVRRYQKAHGSLPCHIIFLMEGAEESASTDLDKYLAKHADRLRGADVLVWEQEIRDGQGRLQISGGNKGIVTFDLSVTSADVDIHSKYGALIESASWYLVQALATLRDRKGRICVPGIYDQVIPPNERELALVDRYVERTAQELVDLYGLQLPVLKKERQEFLKTYFFEPAISIEGLSTGYLGQGVKTILPAQAQAKMEVRLVPGLTPEGVLEAIKAHFVKEGFDRVSVTYTLGEASYRSDMSSPAILNVIEIAERIYPDGVSILPTSAGTGPMWTVYDALEVPQVAFGLGNLNSRDHGGDENVAIYDYVSHIEMIEELIKSYE